MSRFRYQGPIPPHIPNLSQYDRFQQNYVRAGSLHPKFQAFENYAFQLKNDLLSFSDALSLHIQEQDDSPIVNMPDIRDFKASIEFLNKSGWEQVSDYSQMTFNNPICSMCTSWHGDKIAMGSYSKVLNTNFDLLGKEVIFPSHSLPGALAFSRVIQFHPSDRLLGISAAGTTFHLFDTEMNKTVSTLNIHDEIVTGIQFTSCGLKVLSSSRDGILNVTDLIRSKVQRQINVNSSISSFILSKNDDYIALATKDSKVILFDNRCDGEIQNFDAHYGQVTCLATDNEGIIVSGGSDHCVRIWDIRDTISACGTITANASDIKTIQFVNNNQNILYTLSQGLAKEYSLQNALCVKQKILPCHPYATYYHEPTKRLIIGTENCELQIHTM